ncbi:membrane protein [Heyndrickxia sporothermodurans]|nr:membrane protein [Heyndrickxia sporothermodurans]
MYISTESRGFLENLRVYLFSSGKNEKEINEIIEELEDHLYEAEKNGKNIEDIIGKSPKEYMEKVANEISFDLKGLTKYIPIVMLGAFTFIITGKAIRGVLEFSIIDLVGYPLIFLLYLLTTAIVFKYVSSRRLSKIKEQIVLGITGIFPVVLFMALLYLKNSINTNTIEFGMIGNIVAIICGTIIFIWIAVWSKSLATIIIPILLFLPEVFINLTALPDKTKTILNATIPFVLIGIYLFILWNRERIKGKTM